MEKFGEGLSKEEKQEYNEICEEANELSRQIAPLRKKLKKREQRFEKLCQKKWALEKKMTKVKVIPTRKPRKNSSKGNSTSKEKAVASLRALIGQLSEGKISKFEFSKEAGKLVR